MVCTDEWTLWQPGSQRRILVTGSRGKSSVVRLLYAAMQAAGLQTYARITGVVPRELGAGWYPDDFTFCRCPCRGDALVAQAVAGFSAGYCPGKQRHSRRISGSGRALVAAGCHGVNQYPAGSPGAMGSDTAQCAAEVLVKGVPKQGQVVLPAGLETDNHLLELAQSPALPGGFCRACQRSRRELPGGQSWPGTCHGTVAGARQGSGITDDAPPATGPLRFSCCQLRWCQSGDGLFRQRYRQYPGLVPVTEVVPG